MERVFCPVPPKGARPLQSIPAAALPGVQTLLNEGKLSLLTVGVGRAARLYLIPTPPPVTRSSTAQTEQ